MTGSPVAWELENAGRWSPSSPLDLAVLLRVQRDFPFPDRVFSLSSGSLTTECTSQQKIRARFLATPDKSATLESLVVNEQGEKKRIATEGLLWLIRYVAVVLGARPAS